jgi:iron(III) transport system permease protein
LVLISTAIALPLGVAWGWALSRLSGRGRAEGAAGAVLRSVLAGLGTLSIVALFVMLAMPLYIHAAGWEATAGKFGWLPLVQGGPRFWFRGLMAAAWIHGTYGACWIALAVMIAYRSLPRALDDAGRIDAGLVLRDGKVRLPLSAGWIGAATAWSAILAATEMTVADLYAVRTVADDVYKVYALQPEAVPVLVSTVVPPLLAMPLVWWSTRRLTVRRWSGRGRGEAVSLLPRGEERGRSLITVGVAAAIALLMTVLVAAVPLGALVVKAGWTTVVEGGELRASFAWSVAAESLSRAPRSFGRELIWTAQLAGFAVLVTLPLVWGLAAAAQDRSWWRRVAPWLAVLLVMIPGPVVSMWVIWLFNRPSLGFFYDRTLLPSLCAVMPRAVPIAYLVMRANYRGLDPAVGELAAIDGPSHWQRLWRVQWPRLRRGVLLAVLAVVLVVVGDLSATILVLPPSVTTVSSRLFGLLHSGVRNMEASLALLVAFFAAVLALWIRRVVR